MPDEYIKREAALMKLMQDGCSAKNLQSILEMPAADVAEVVRCKDCKHWQRHTGVVDSPNGHCFALETCTNGMDFCNYGEYQTNTGGSNNVAD